VLVSCLQAEQRPQFVGPGVTVAVRNRAASTGVVEQVGGESTDAVLSLFQHASLDRNHPAQRAGFGLEMPVQSGREPHVFMMRG
jgi:hypothetical protein